MKLDTSHLRYLTPDDWRVLVAVELGSRTHLLVPLSLIHKLSHSHSPSHTTKSLWALSKAGLVSTLKNARYEGFRLSYGGLDHLALRAHSKSGALYSVGNQIGTGKESDVFAVAPPVREDEENKKPRGQHRGIDGVRGRERQSTKGKASLTSLDAKRKAQENTQYILKLHRLGRISFRSVRTNRDYLSSKTHKPSSASSTFSQSATWLHLSRLAALKEWTFLSLLHQHGFPVPKPIAHNRHSIVMELIDGFPLRQIESIPDPQGLYAELIELILRLARYGLVHGDFNEFNILIREDEIKEEKEQNMDLDRSGEEYERDLEQSKLETGSKKGGDERDARKHRSMDPTVDGVEQANTQSSLALEAHTTNSTTPTTSTTQPHADTPLAPSPSSRSPSSPTLTLKSIPSATPKPKPPTSRTKLTPILIDFPQMVSMSHANAGMYFDRDVSCIKRYFTRRFGFTSDEPGPFFEDALKTVGKDGAKMLDVEAYASGFSRKMARELEGYLEEEGRKEEGKKGDGRGMEDGRESEDSGGSGEIGNEDGEDGGGVSDSDGDSDSL